MGREHRPRAGSLQFWPRKRARRIYPRIRAWAKTDNTKVLGFAGYKVGMTHIMATNNNPNVLAKGLQAVYPATIIECPPLKPLSLRFYKQTPYGIKLVSEMFSQKLDKELGRKITIPKKTKEGKVPEDITDIKLVVYTQPKIIGLKKKPDIFELGIGGNIKDKIEFGKKLLESEIKIRDVIKEGQFIDVHSVTKGKGFQGPIQRFGLSLKARKSEKKKRSAGNLGPWHPSKVSYTVPQHGQMGFHTRTDYNKLILSINNNPELINRVGGFRHYGAVKSDYILVKGSVPGTVRRLIRFTDSIRNRKSIQPLEINQIIK